MKTFADILAESLENDYELKERLTVKLLQDLAEELKSSCFFDQNISVYESVLAILKYTMPHREYNEWLEEIEKVN